MFHLCISLGRFREFLAQSESAAGSIPSRSNSDPVAILQNSGSMATAAFLTAPVVRGAGCNVLLLVLPLRKPPL